MERNSLKNPFPKLHAPGFYLSTFQKQIQGAGRGVIHSILRPILTKLKSVFVKPKEEPASLNRLSDWKEKAIDDFRTWLNELPDEEACRQEDQPSMESADLYTVLKEFAALRQEIKLQNREQNRAVKSLTAFIDDYKYTADLFRERTAALSTLEERIRLSSEKTVVAHFLDIRDALSRGKRAASELIGRKSLFLSTEKYEGVKEGYEMAIRRFDRALATLGIFPIDAVGKKFDPQTMRAIGTAQRKGVEPGSVIEEERSGFIRDQEILRAADVIVNK
jgi:molecular chaperone GrpE (heat shock protein)